MAEGDDGNVLSVDIDELMRRRVDIKHLGTVTATIKTTDLGDLFNYVNKTATNHAHGSGRKS